MSDANEVAPGAYAYWRGVLAGERLPVVEDEPQCGFYRRKDNGRHVPIAIWQDQNGLQMLEGGEPVGGNRQLEVWMWCAKSAIEESTYHAMLVEDAPDDPVYGELDSDAESLLRRAARLTNLPTRIESEADAMRLADALHMSRAIEKRAEDRRKEMEAPHKDMVAKIGAIWNHPAAVAKAAQDPIKAALLARIKELGPDENGKYPNIKGQLGKAVSMRTKEIRTVTNHAAALQWIIDNDPNAFMNYIDAIIAKRNDDEDIPGTEFITTESVQ